MFEPVYVQEMPKKDILFSKCLQTFQGQNVWGENMQTYYWLEQSRHNHT